jgi:hypothetical protein
MGGGLGVASLPGDGWLTRSYSCCRAEKQFDVGVGLSQFSLNLAILESLDESWVGRLRLLVGVIHWSGWEDVVVCC